MGRLGAHVSVSGGISLSIARARSIGCESFQIFTRNQRQWEPKPLDDHDVEEFKRKISVSEIFPVVSHGSYLINPAGPEDGVRKRSITALTDELYRCMRLSIDRLVIHPGSHKGSGIRSGIRNVAAAVDEAFATLENNENRSRPAILLETTAGQGTGLGSRLEEISEMMELSSNIEDLGVCLDTAHMHAAGYDLTNKEAYGAVMDEVSDIIGMDKVLCIHLNDSKKVLGSKVDRHQNLGEGTMGTVPFECFVNDERLKEVPMILETPGGDEFYRKNLEMLKGMRIQ